jgi:hypothetical protein
LGHDAFVSAPQTLKIYDKSIDMFILGDLTIDLADASPLVRRRKL